MIRHLVEWIRLREGRDRVTMLADPAATAHTRLHKCFFFNQITSLPHCPDTTMGAVAPISSLSLTTKTFNCLR
ncbi:hypothetical protein AERO9A_300097 [Aeromonas salmonicida]|nr:hypothetical protein AERO9A_300097 [Aeromonas salmonicida]